MHIKSLFILSFLLVLCACKKTQESNNELQNKESTQNKNITDQDIAKLKYVEYILDAKIEKIVQDWPEYIQLEDIIINAKKGDLEFFNDNKKVIQLLLKDLKKNVPKALHYESILSRLLVLETRLLKLESLLNLTTTTKEETLENIKDFLEAFSNLNFQINKKVEFNNRVIERP